MNIVSDASASVEDDLTVYVGGARNRGPQVFLATIMGYDRNTIGNTVEWNKARLSDPMENRYTRGDG